mmetsp:Transcript_8040/g.21729  ORF Transcript_8040/g.21729 Transcript_8040/m.21729 type:complete len:304 (+) Transcript_8040:43-954(+)
MCELGVSWRKHRMIENRRVNCNGVVLPLLMPCASYVCTPTTISVGWEHVDELHKPGFQDDIGTAFLHGHAQLRGVVCLALGRGRLDRLGRGNANPLATSRDGRPDIIGRVSHKNDGRRRLDLEQLAGPPDGERIGLGRSILHAHAAIDVLLQIVLLQELVAILLRPARHDAHPVRSFPQLVQRGLRRDQRLQIAQARLAVLALVELLERVRHLLQGQILRAIRIAVDEVQRQLPVVVGSALGLPVAHDVVVDGRRAVLVARGDDGGAVRLGHLCEDPVHVQQQGLVWCGWRHLCCCSQLGAVR